MFLKQITAEAIDIKAAALILPFSIIRRKMTMVLKPREVNCVRGSIFSGPNGVGVSVRSIVHDRPLSTICGQSHPMDKPLLGENALVGCIGADRDAGAAENWSGDEKAFDLEYSVPRCGVFQG